MPAWGGGSKVYASLAPGDEALAHPRQPRGESKRTYGTEFAFLQDCHCSMNLHRATGKRGSDDGWEQKCAMHREHEQEVTMLQIRTIITVCVVALLCGLSALFAHQLALPLIQNVGSPSGWPGIHNPAATGITSVESFVPKVSMFLGMPVLNPYRERLGTIEDLKLDLVAGRIAYAALAYGRFLGVGGKLIAVPWDALKPQLDGKAVVLNISKDMLNNIPGFDKDHWPKWPDPALSAAVRQAAVERRGYPWGLELDLVIAPWSSQ